LFQGSTPNPALLKLLACNPVTQEPNLELAKYIEHDNTNNFVKFQSYDLKKFNYKKVIIIVKLEKVLWHFYLESANFEVHKLSKVSESLIVRGQSATPVPPAP